MFGWTAHVREAAPKTAEHNYVDTVIKVRLLRDVVDLQSDLGERRLLTPEAERVIRKWLARRGDEVDQVVDTGLPAQVRVPSPVDSGDVRYVGNLLEEAVLELPLSTLEA